LAFATETIFLFKKTGLKGEPFLCSVVKVADGKGQINVLVWEGANEDQMNIIPFSL